MTRLWRQVVDAAAEPGVAKGKLALTLLHNADTRAKVLDDVYEVRRTPTRLALSRVVELCLVEKTSTFQGAAPDP